MKRLAKFLTDILLWPTYGLILLIVWLLDLQEDKQ